ncbi:J domain-containing protein [Thermoflavimicrobium dichotomicum]|uniref:DnaJ domain-containing protein n=1 Tax=Thermoflavimicrobium dichotomicum TaxID=46223 RepID=A0A1I3LN60_9BACL|nr:DnaJ domain-containing protein [Thermoflavimicrobium dichotomicum]SFI86133.1 DnaJ domain-containing protein [Thermoflavimicrobium dichotomicum]
MKDYYQLLGVSQQASKEEIEQAILQQMRVWTHRINAPTLTKRQEAERMVEELEQIKEILLDDEKRKQYDQELEKSRKLSVVDDKKQQRETKEEEEADQKEIESKEQTSSEPVFQDQTVSSDDQTAEKSEEEESKERQTEVQKKDTEPPSSQPVVQQPIKEEQTKPSPRLKKGWMVGLVLVAIVIASVVTLFALQGGFGISSGKATPLSLNQPVVIDNKYILTLKDIRKQGNRTSFKLSIKPTDQEREVYQNTAKNKEFLQKMLDSGQVEKRADLVDFVQKPIFKIELHLEDSSGNQMVKMDTTQASYTTAKASGDMEEVFEWSIANLPDSSHVMVIDMISRFVMKEDISKNLSGQTVIKGEEMISHYQERFELPRP